MKLFVMNEIKKLQSISCSHYGKKAIIDPILRFDLNGGTFLGKAVSPSRANKKWIIRVNPEYFANNSNHIKKELIAHEYAHIVTCEIYGKKCKPHGKEWKEVARVLGAVPKASYVTKDTYIPKKTRELKRYNYTCGCNEYKLSSIRHNRTKKGISYYCKKCGEKLVMGDKES